MLMYFKQAMHLIGRVGRGDRLRDQSGPSENSVVVLKYSEVRQASFTSFTFKLGEIPGVVCSVK